MIHKDTMNTSSTVPGHMVISVLRTNRVLKLIRFSAPMLREEASVNSCGDGAGRGGEAERDEEKASRGEEMQPEEGSRGNCRAGRGVARQS